VAYLPYLAYAPPAWTLALVYAGGGLSSLGGTAIDAEGNAWAADNFLVGAQSTLSNIFGGGLSVLSPSGRPISPMTLGYRGGGVDGPAFGLAVTDDKVWVTSLAGKTISVFDRATGNALSPPTGYNFNGQLGAMQGIISTRNGDIWAVDNDKSQIVYFPKGDPAQGRILCRTVDGKPVDGTCKVDGPFHLAIDQQDRIWITNGNNGTVTRFPASDPSKADILKVNYSPKAIAVDSLGNVWVNNALGNPGIVEKLELLWDKIVGWLKSSFSRGPATDQQAVLFRSLYETAVKNPGGNVTLFRPDGTEAPGSPFNGANSIIGPWGIAIDGNDNVWVANALARSFTELCGMRTENCPPGYKTGDPISPPKTGYFGQGLQILTDIAVDPAGNVWLANNWDQANVGMMQIPDQALSTRFGGNGFVVFFGLAKPVKTPLIGQVRAW
jgi:streptogramin lyase